MNRSAILIRGHRRESFDEIVEEPPFGILHIQGVGFDLHCRDSAGLGDGVVIEGLYLRGLKYKVLT